MSAALASLRAPPAVPDAVTPGPGNPAKTKLAELVARKGTPVVIGLGEELSRRGFFGLLEKREPAPLDDDDEDDIAEALGAYLATIMPDSEVDPLGKFLIVFLLAFGGAWLSGEKIIETATVTPATTAERAAAAAS